MGSLPGTGAVRPSPPIPGAQPLPGGSCWARCLHGLVAVTDGWRQQAGEPKSPSGPYLQQVVRGVVQGHDQGPRSDVVGKPGEADQDDGCHVVDDLLFEVLP